MKAKSGKNKEGRDPFKSYDTVKQSKVSKGNEK